MAQHAVGGGGGREAGRPTPPGGMRSSRAWFLGIDSLRTGWDGGSPGASGVSGVIGSQCDICTRGALKRELV